MRRFFTDRLDGPQCSGKPLEPIGEVDLGETFIITILEEERETLGPLFIKGVKPRNVVSIHIEDIHITKYWGIEPDYAMIPEIADQMLVVEGDMGIELPFHETELLFPGGGRIPLRPMIGSISLAAMHSCPNPWAHGGNMDINEIRKGSTVYIRAQREGGLLALGDLHAYQGDGEIAGCAVEAIGEVKVTVDITDRLPAPRPVIEVEDKVITVGMELTYWAAVKSAVRDMTYLLMKAYNLSIDQAYTVAVQGGNLRNGAIWMMNDHPYITMQSDQYRVPRTVFLEFPVGQSLQ